MKDEEIKKAVRQGYARVAKQTGSCCGPATPCCGSADMAQNIGKAIGYSDEDMVTVPEGANLGACPSNRVGEILRI
jgi:hypothetical protein